ncbi:Tn3 family transposase [Leisingera sp. XS_AS12]|uniref:Tn3 family transposase n=1 Tax=Leisingera sp. XS_AS12 TaxID=3241294 RepID=UPI003513A389
MRFLRVAKGACGFRSAFLDGNCQWPWPSASGARKANHSCGGLYTCSYTGLQAAIIIFWNTMKLGEVVANHKRDGKLLSPDLLVHVSPLGWEHINLTGEYRWPKP